MWRGSVLTSLNQMVGSSSSLSGASRRLLSSSLPPLSSSSPSSSYIFSSFFLRRNFTTNTVGTESAFNESVERLNKKQKIHWTEKDLGKVLSLVTTDDDFEQARDVFEEVRRHLRELSPRAFHKLVRTGIRTSNMTIPLQIFTLPANARLYPSEAVLVKLLRQLYKTGDLEGVDKLHTSARNNNYDIGERYYYEHIHWSNKLNSPEKAQKYFDELLQLPNNRLGKTNAAYEYTKILGSKGAWKEILELGDKVQIPKSTTLRFQIVAALQLGDKKKAKQLLEEPETVAKSPLKKHYEYFNNPEVLPLLQEILQEIVAEKRVDYGDDPELLLLRIRLHTEEAAKSGGNAAATEQNKQES